MVLRLLMPKIFFKALFCLVITNTSRLVPYLLLPGHLERGFGMLPPALSQLSCDLDRDWQIGASDLRLWLNALQPGG